MEAEIKKHAKNIFKVAGNSQFEIFEKIRDICIEIIIIVIAVSISIALHNWNESRHNRQEEKEFLIGLQKDLQGDIENMESSRMFYEESVQGLTFFLTAANKPSRLSKDSVNKYLGIFFSSTDLDPHIERYEGLKSSGKFTIIENKELLNNIINLHEVIIQRIHILNNKYYAHQERLESIISQNIQMSTSVTNVPFLLRRGDILLSLRVGKGIIANNIIPFHTSGIKACKDIIAQIDEQLK
jgi:hypothetical protein